MPKSDNIWEESLRLRQVDQTNNAMDTLSFAKFICESFVEVNFETAKEIPEFKYIIKIVGGYITE